MADTLAVILVRSAESGFKVTIIHPNGTG
jgi:hypothetical protein